MQDLEGTVGVKITAVVSANLKVLNATSVVGQDTLHLCADQSVSLPSG